MTLRARIAVLLGIVALVGNGFLLYLGSGVISKGFGALERDQAQRHAALAAGRIADETVRLGEIALDYASRDDMWAYALDPSGPFIEGLLPPTWLSRARLHLVAVVDPGNRVLFSRMRIGALVTRQVPPGFGPHLGRARPLVTHAVPESSVSGVIPVGPDLWIVASRPIVTSQGAGPIRGTVVLGRRVDEELLHVAEGVSLPARLDALTGAVPIGGGFSMRPDGAGSMTALVPLAGIPGEPVPVLGIDLPRSAEAQRRGTQFYLAVALLGAWAFFLVTVIALMNHYLVKRMTVLAGFLRYVHVSGNLASRLPSGTGDEIGQVTIEINDLLTTIETRNKDLEAARAQALGAMGEVQDKNLQLEQANQLIERLARTDPLTKLANRRMFDECLARQVSLAERHGEAFTVMMADLDNFKSLNDAHGHLAGDGALAQAAAVIAGHVRAHDVAARYGGEEFVLLMTNTVLAEGIAVAERIRSEIERIPVSGSSGRVTMSAGVAQWMPGESATAVVARADEALFRAKRAGRNRIEGNVLMRVKAVARPA